jgi:hypothetical protein
MSTSHEAEHATNIPRVPERFLTGEAPLKDYLTYLQGMQPVQQSMMIGDYLTLTDWAEKLATALDIPEGEEQP